MAAGSSQVEVQFPTLAIQLPDGRLGGQRIEWCGVDASCLVSRGLAYEPRAMAALVQPPSIMDASVLVKSQWDERMHIKARKTVGQP